MPESLAWIDGLGAGRELALWVALCIALYVVCAHLSWRLHHLEDGLLGGVVRRVRGWRFRQLAWQLLRLLFYVVVPYSLLVHRRLLSGRMMGLVGPGPEGVLGWPPGAWAQGFGWALLCGLGGAAVLGGAWWGLARRLPPDHGFSLHHRPAPLGLAWDAFFLQVHWGFYRAAAGVWLGNGRSYLGVLVGLALVGLEATGDPGLHFDRHWPSLASGWVRLAAVAWLTSFLFFQTRSLWLGMLLHWSMTWGLNAVGGRLSQRTLPTIAESG